MNVIIDKTGFKQLRFVIGGGGSCISWPAERPSASGEVFCCIQLIDKTWSVTIRRKHMLRVFENRLLESVFGSKGGCEELPDCTVS